MAVLDALLFHYTLILPILIIYIDDFAVLFFLATANPESEFQALNDEQSSLIFVYRILQCISNAYNHSTLCPVFPCGSLIRIYLFAAYQHAVDIATPDPNNDINP